MRLLLVEDNFFVAMEMESLLTGDGYDVIVAASMQEAIRAVEEDEPPVLAVVDLGLADGSTGADLVRALAERNVPSLICSGQTEGRARESIGEIPVTGFLTKPFDPDVLLATVRAVLDRR